MPVMGGLELCRRLKADRGTRDVPVLLVSAVDQQQGESAGADAYVSKPFSPRALLAKVREYLPA